MPDEKTPERTAKEIAQLRWNALNIFTRQTAKHCDAREIVVWYAMFVEGKLHERKPHTVTTISTYRLAEMTGYSRSQVVKAIHGLVSKKLLVRQSPEELDRHSVTTYAVRSIIKLSTDGLQERSHG